MSDVGVVRLLRFREENGETVGCRRKIRRMARENSVCYNAYQEGFKSRWYVSCPLGAAE